MIVSSFLIVFVGLFVAWVVGFAFHLLGSLIHLLLLLAFISLAVHFGGGVHRPHSPCGLLDSQSGKDLPPIDAF